MPPQVVDAARREKVPSIAYTYSGRIAFYEYMMDTAKIAKSSGIKNVWVTQAYINEKPLRELCNYLDAANVDLKYFNEKTYAEVSAGRLQTVLNSLKILKEEKVWFEITNLVIPSINDNLDEIREMCRWIVKNLGRDYPLHFSRFHPQYKLLYLPPTPTSTLEDARNIAIDEGLKFVYIGNVPGHKGQNTYCPNDGKLLIERKGYKIVQNNVEEGHCRYCGEKIAGVWSV